MDLTPESYRSQVLSGQDHWILDFYAPWCGPCQHFAPEFEVLARVSYFFLINLLPGNFSYVVRVSHSQVDMTFILKQTFQQPYAVT